MKSISLFIGCICLVLSVGILIQDSAIEASELPPLDPSQVGSTHAALLTIVSSSYTPHAPIEVSNDIELTAIAGSGTGTKADPYLIEGWNITTSGNGISVQSTTKHFIIRDCWIKTGRSSYTTGIVIQNVVEGTAIISNNFCLNNYRGIEIVASASILVVNNTCRSNEEVGISVTGSKNTTVIHNSCNNNAQSITNSNPVKSLSYIHPVGGVIVSGSSASRILNNTCNHNTGSGIFIRGSTNTTITHNKCSYNTGAGIDIVDTPGLTLRRNSCQRNHMGIEFWTDADPIPFLSKNCTLTENLLIENSGYGISLSSASENLLYHNTFLVNNNDAVQALDKGVNNTWFHSSTQGGNYWLDYNGTGAYFIVGSGNAIDPYPLGDVLDYDEDGLPNGWEYRIGFNVTLNEAEGDYDGDGLPNLWEYQREFNAIDPRDASDDSDGDGLTNLQEYHFGTHPKNSDTDGDKIPDAYEWEHQLNGTLNDAAEDADNDGLSNFQEYQHGSNPQDRDSDNDFFPDGLDYNWWGNPRVKWDNPLTRGLFLAFLLGTGLWGAFLTRQLPILHRMQKQQLQHLQQQVDRFQAKILVFHTLDSLQELEEAADLIHQLFKECTQTIQSTQHLISRKGLPPFLRPDLTPFETIATSMTEIHTEFQHTRLTRVQEFMVHEGSFLDSTEENSNNSSLDRH